MTHKLGSTLAAAIVLAVAGVIGSVSTGSARSAQDFPGAAADPSPQANQLGGGKFAQHHDQPAGGQRGAVQSRGNQRSGATQRSVAQPRSIQRNTVQPRNVQRNVTQPRNVQRNVVQPKNVQRNVVQPRDVQRNTVQRNIAQPSGIQAQHGMQGASLRGANRIAFGGRNYSVYRDSYRVRRSDGWRTFVAISTLGTFALGASMYYPYAYISAPAPRCSGLTEDGCQLRWMDVQTVEGPVVSQCVAYCPWQ